MNLTMAAGSLKSRELYGGAAVSEITCSWGTVADCVSRCTGAGAGWDRSWEGAFSGRVCIVCDADFEVVSVTEFCMGIEVNSTIELCGDVGRREVSVGGTWQLVTCCETSSTITASGDSGTDVVGGSEFVNSRGTVFAGTTGRSPRTCE